MLYEVTTCNKQHKIRCLAKLMFVKFVKEYIAFSHNKRPRWEYLNNLSTYVVQIFMFMNEARQTINTLSWM